MDTADKAVQAFIADEKYELIYPPIPNNKLTENEIAAIKKIRNIPNIESVLKKIIANTSAIAAFNFLNCIDGTGDPSSKAGEWTGVALIDRDNLGDNDPYGNMLHDVFFASYQNWKEKFM